MPLPVNQFVFAGEWSATTSYPQYQFVVSPIDGKCYVNTNIQSAKGGADPSVQPSQFWELYDPKFGVAQQTILSTYVLPNGTFFDPSTFIGSVSATIGSFKIPADIVPNSSALLYWSGWSVQSWSPVANLNLLDYRIGFSPVKNGGVGTFYTPYAGFVVNAPNNANNIPLTIPHLPHTSPNPLAPDYTQVPQWITLPNLQPDQDIFANVECAYPADEIQGVGLYAPFLLYQKQ
jgi:hypothetical protein